MNKKVYILCFLLIILVLTNGCGDTWFKAKIISPLDEYSPTMSSVPGFPLKIEFDIAGPHPSISSITYTTDKGRYIEWEDNKTVINLGKTAKLSGKPIYWTPLEEDGKIVDSAKIKVIISYFDKIVEVTKLISVKIYKNKNGMYTLR